MTLESLSQEPLEARIIELHDSWTLLCSQRRASQIEAGILDAAGRRMTQQAETTTKNKGLEAMQAGISQLNSTHHVQHVDHKAYISL